MKKTILGLVGVLALFSVLYCPSGNADPDKRNATSVGKLGWVFEGWACAPDSSKAMQGLSPAQYCNDDSQKDYLYMKFSAAAEQGSIDSGMISKMMATCREAARLQVAGDGMVKIIGEYIEKAAGVSNGQSTGVAIVSQARGQVRGVGLYDCCAMDNDTGACVKPDLKQNWAQCICVGYMKYPGGQKAMVTKAKELAGVKE